MNLNELYQELIIEHGTHPRNFYTLNNCQYQSHGYNPLCGDEIKLFINLSSDKNQISEVSFTGSGCAISMASASLLTDYLKKDPSLKNAKELFKSIINNLTNQLNDDDLKIPLKLQALNGVKKFPTRIKCATLAWHALEDIICRIK